MKVLEDKENSLLSRREVKIIVEAEKNPSFSEALKIISNHFKVPEELISANEIKGKFGRNTFLVSAFIYKTLEEKKLSEKKKQKEEDKSQQAQTAEKK